jgi:zinc transport system substrate-binding protein
MKMHRVVAVLGLVALVLSLAVPSARAAQGGPLRVLVTIEPQAWLVERVAGPLAQVTVMVPPGADPHTFEPRPSQMAEVDRADLYLSLGLEFETVWLPRFLAASPGLKVVPMDAGIAKLPMPAHGHVTPKRSASHGHPRARPSRTTAPTRRRRATPRASPMSTGEQPEGRGPRSDHDHDHDHAGLPDPHIWLAPELMQVMAAATRDALTRADPANAQAYAAGCEAAVAEARAVHDDLAALFAGLTERRFMVFHPSWGYFAREFDLVQMPVEGRGSEPGPRTMVKLVAEAREHGVRAVFVSPQFSQRSAGVVAQEGGGALVEADPLARDWAANLRAVAGRMAKAMSAGN